jgi:hypothetical protein
MGVNLLTLAKYTLKGPFQAATVVGLLAVLAVFVPPFFGLTFFSLVLTLIATILATILVGLIILTQGSVSGLKVIGVSVLGVTLVTWLVLNSPEQGILMGLIYWLPIVVFAQTLRSSNSLSLTLLAGVLIGIVGVWVQYLFWGDQLSEWISQLQQNSEVTANFSQEDIEKTIVFLQMVGLITISSLYVFFTLVLFAARSLQAKLAGSDGFNKEFRALTLGKPAATFALILFALLLLLLTFWKVQIWIISLMMLLTITFMFQGVAVVHARLADKNKRTLLLVLLYLVLIFLSQIAVPLTAIAGLIDNWLVFRKKPASPNDINLN